MKKYTIGEITRSFVELNTFMAEWKSNGLTDDDLFELEIWLMQNSREYPVIQGTGGLRKMRFTPKRLNMGKSGGYRIIYLDLEENYTIILFVAYSKGTQENLSKAEKVELKKLVEILKAHYGREF